MENRLKRKLSSGLACVGPFINIQNPAVVEMAALAGFDFVIIDMEHGLFNRENLENMVRAAEIHGITPVVRVPEDSTSAILSALEAGAQGIEAPHIESVSDAEKVVEAVKYFPEGMRGVSPYTRAARYSSIPPRQHFETSNRETMVILQIEGIKGVENLEAIASLKGVDVLFAGPYDLSQAFGVPGEVEHPKVLQTIEKVVKVCDSRGLHAGTFAPSVEKARRWINSGMRFIAYSVDTGILYNAFKQSVDEIRR